MLSKRPRVLLFLLAILATTLLPAAEPEFRARWVSRYEWPSADQRTAFSKIRGIMRELAEHNFNAVLFQIRGQCDVHYPSPYEPWSSNYNYRDPGFDPTAFAIQEAHRQGLEFHAYINTHTIAPAKALPPSVTRPQHPFNTHARPGVADSWVIHDANGRPALDVDGYVWMSPGHPGASVWTRQVVMHVVNTYDIDGLHFDRIRTPGKEYSRDPVSMARFSGRGNPHGLDWGGFMREQITRDLRRIYGAVRQAKPDIVISSAPFGINSRQPGGYQGRGTESRNQWYQDSFVWMEEGMHDMLCPQLYWPLGGSHPFEVLLSDFMKHRGGRHMVPGINSKNNIIAQINEARRQRAAGTTIWGKPPWDALKRGPYAERAPIPARPWLTSPKTGIIVGYVKNQEGQAVYDAWIRINGHKYTFLSGGDGFYAILNVPPGEHSVTFSWQPEVWSEGQKVNVLAGKVTQLDVEL